ncbi:hypothetical protein DNTS_027498 [Danionella cerebrum]|uniref:Uncharacterized protein n=1 Tax=Danionella cerebrum TaxID=2873325 RepID=A0A553QRN6_9TELE|nr:hypothetical protein DNTS_027498 [Danionella translucida]
MASLLQLGSVAICSILLEIVMTQPEDPVAGAEGLREADANEFRGSENMPLRLMSSALSSDWMLNHSLRRTPANTHVFFHFGMTPTRSGFLHTQGKGR